MTANLQQRLVKAREDCLLGNYDDGAATFYDILQELNRKYVFSADESIRKFLHDLRHEYSELAAYQRLLKELQDAASTVPQSYARRRDEAEKHMTHGIGTVSQPQERKICLHRKRSAHLSVVHPNRIQKAQGSGKNACSRKFTKDHVKSQGVLAIVGAPVSHRARGKENEPGNALIQTSAPTADRKKVGSRQASRKRINSGKQDVGRSTPLETNAMTGIKPKYSEIARENGWADQELIQSIERDIVECSESVSFNDIAGLQHTKQLLQEAVMLPLIAPHLFENGMLKPCNGILMFGPPGTGKTLLAKAVAHECGTTFFNVSASTFSSKYRGDSEKMVRILFEMARYYSPSVVFMDEIDAIASARGATNEHEASRRMKTELLVQLNGVSSADSNQNARVILLAATNLPWELDEAMRRRLTKRVYIPLPNEKARHDLFRISLAKVRLAEDVNLSQLIAETHGYSGDDIISLCESAKRMPVKRVYTPDLLNELLMQRRSSISTHDLQKLQETDLVITREDFRQALANVSKSVNQEQLLRFGAWEEDFGSK